MDQLDRRSALAIGLAAASIAVVKPATSQTMDTGKDQSPWPGVVVRTYGESPSIIPGFKTVSMRDIIMQPGSKTAFPPMPNAMVCHITEGELRIDQDGKIFYRAPSTGDRKLGFLRRCPAAFHDENARAKGMRHSGVAGSARRRKL